MPSPFNVGPIFRALRIGKSGRGQGDARLELETDAIIRMKGRAAPSSCQVGDMYMTTAGVLKVCTTAGTPGTWTSAGAQT